MAHSHRQTWLTRQQRRHASPFFLLLDRSFGFRVLIAAILSFALLSLVNRFDNCHGADPRENCLTSNFLDVISIGNVESFSIVTAGFVYIIEAGRRKEKEHHEQLTLLLAQQETGVKYSLGRIRAIEDLSSDGIWQDDFDLHGTNLEGLRIPFSRWRGGNFANTVLRKANLRGSDLKGANFKEADLTGADLSGSDLTQANFTRAILTNADLSGAILTGTVFQDADLRGSNIDQSLAALNDRP
ncbi:pentapeptide repeat-containing protein [Synechococcus sp. J7-Johnson]|uniref:pentapeptide repeat-containing protein n=1 Tax=Synechococcus sp. J7-Johnson TaxID=2823737 RepID=UPI0020CDD5E8|nr:pentapeptide repeat-containing protein [Synechococcus sp. J7-Johnson]MCP9839247.1 pentapeptide repeat-containing protein [Synechococcus sp. J7-Johnson]